ncbi:NAD(P)-dependent oxidoreductase [Limisalsivibrio acetivorans]|uniref:NAD(P)-dependent oxidoreductase n=1 Tax=Limisalsivibrio acetivorans TaxID=1304888 RepID=UPI0003B3C3BF|nr:NAD(P)-dependent oxidoreductase [Limisalsivibrio acetivorans]
MKTGFIGLGNLGKALAERLMDEGYDLTVWNRTIKKADGLGADISVSPKEVAEKSDTIVLNLFDTDAVLDVFGMDGGLLDADLKGKTIIDTSTNHYKEVLEVYEIAEAEGFSYLEAPVLGSVVPAKKGMLVVVVSGDEPAFNEHKAFFDTIGRDVFYLREPGAASRMKVINNMLLGVFMTSIAEAVAFGEKAGLDKSDVIDVLSTGGGKSLVFDAKKQKLADEDFSAHFSASAIYKDLGYLQRLAEDVKMPLYTAGAAKELYAETFRRGLSEEDFSVVYKMFK